jgi:opacity protein-like surface antigen
MKKVLLVLALLIVISASAFADHPAGLGIGVVGGYYGGWSGSGHSQVGLSLKVPKLPIFWGVNLQIHKEYFALGVTGDYYIIDNKLVPAIGLNWYLGVGGYGGISFGDDLTLAVGARVPIGLSWQPINLLEIFIDIAPSLGIRINPVDFPDGGWPVEIGIRLWL